MENRNNDTISFIAGGLLGAVAGVAIGLLFAPTTGAHTRKRLAKQTRDLAKELNKSIQKLDEQTLQPQIKTVKKYVREQLDNTAEEIKRKSEEVKDYADKQIKAVIKK